MRQNLRVLSGVFLFCCASYIGGVNPLNNKTSISRLEGSFCQKVYNLSNKFIRTKSVTPITADHHMKPNKCRAGLSGILTISHNRLQKTHAILVDIETAKGVERHEIIFKGQYNLNNSDDLKALIEKNTEYKDFKVLALWMVIYSRKGKLYKYMPLTPEYLTECLVNDVSIGY